MLFLLVMIETFKWPYTMYHWCSNTMGHTCRLAAPWLCLIGICTEERGTPLDIPETWVGISATGEAQTISAMWNKDLVRQLYFIRRHKHVFICIYTCTCIVYLYRVIYIRTFVMCRSMYLHICKRHPIAIILCVDFVERICISSILCWEWVLTVFGRKNSC